MKDGGWVVVHPSKGHVKKIEEAGQKTVGGPDQCWLE